MRQGNRPLRRTSMRDWNDRTSVRKTQTSVYGGTPLFCPESRFEKGQALGHTWKCPEPNPTSVRVQISSEMLLRSADLYRQGPRARVDRRWTIGTLPPMERTGSKIRCG